MFAAPLYSAMRRDAPPGDGQCPPSGAAARELAPLGPAAGPPTPAAPAAAVALGQRNQQAPNGGVKAVAFGDLGIGVERPPMVLQQGVPDPFPPMKMMMMMMKRGGVGAVAVTPVRCSTGLARPACLTTLNPLRLRLPDGGVPLRRERPMAASTGRTPGARASPVARNRERTGPCLLLRPRRPGASGEGVGRRRGDLLVGTFASWTRSVQ